MPLNAGILIIGSLLWDKEDNPPAWRDARLDIASAETVTAPIRYGRLSGKKRGHTYTMVFSRLRQIGSYKFQHKFAVTRRIADDGEVSESNRSSTLS